MEFLLIWVLGNDVIDSGLRYKNAAKCFSESQNAAAEMREVGLSAPQFTWIKVSKREGARHMRITRGVGTSDLAGSS